MRAAQFSQLTRTQRWRVTLSYFDRGEAGDGMPGYVAGFDLHENGVTTDLTMDFGDFALAGTMTSIEFLETAPLPVKPCSSRWIAPPARAEGREIDRPVEIARRLLSFAQASAGNLFPMTGWAAA